MKILIVEDDIMIADLLEENLQAFGHEVCGITDHVVEAIRLIRQHRPQMIILDMQLNGELGSDVVDYLPPIDLANLGVLYITGTPENVLTGRHAGHAVLRKPYRQLMLSQAIDAVAMMVAGGVNHEPLPYGFQVLHGRSIPHRAV